MKGVSLVVALVGLVVLVQAQQTVETATYAIKTASTIPGGLSTVRSPHPSIIWLLFLFVVSH